MFPKTVWHSVIIPATQEVEVGELKVQGQLGQNSAIASQKSI